jgi:hypothetical protein
MTEGIDHHAIQRGFDAVFHYGAILVRALGYALLGVFAAQYEAAQPVLAGVFCGDAFAQLVRLAVQGRDSWQKVAADALILLVVGWLTKAHFALPDDLTMRAVFGLAALGALAGNFRSCLPRH